MQQEILENWPFSTCGSNSSTLGVLAPPAITLTLFA